MSDSPEKRSLFEELKRRRVFRVATLYAAVAWLLIQIGEATFEPFGLPDASQRLLIILLGAGFPIVLVLGWVFDLTMTRTDEQSEIDASELQRRRRIDFGVVISLIFAVGLLFWGLGRLPQQTPTSDSVDAQNVSAGILEDVGLPSLQGKPSIVVLPFDNMSDAPEQGYFADGITEDLTDDLASVRDLFVIARNTAFTDQGKAVRAEEIARELGVRYVLEGSVRRVDDRVRVTAQLIDAATGLHAWSDRYDRELSDIFAIQTEIAEQIVTALPLQVQEAERRRIRHKPTESLTAYEAFLRGHAHSHRLTRDDNQRAREFFERAVELNPTYSDAHWGVGVTHERERMWLSGQRRAEALDLAEQAARRSHELDALNPRAEVLLAYVASERGRLDEGLVRATRAVELGPSLADSHTILAMLQSYAGNLEAGLESAERAWRLDPQIVSPGLVGMIHYHLGHIDEGVTWLERGRAANPDIIPPRALLASRYQSIGRHVEAKAVVDEILRSAPAMTAEGAIQEFARFREANAGQIAENLRKAGPP